MSIDRDLWYTPPHVLECVNALLGGWFDPCPVNPIVNGLEISWGDVCFINPPYSKVDKKAFIEKGIREYNITKRFLWLVNFRNSAAVTILQEYSSATCLPYERIRFIPGNPEMGNGSSPRHDSIFFLWGATTGFKEAFRNIGDVYVK